MLAEDSERRVDETTVRNVTGFIGGMLLAPCTGLVSWARQSRMFHPTGTVFAAHVHVCTEDPAARPVAERLSGPALVRWSSAWWKRFEWRDVLGCAIRFTHLPLQAHARDGDQDLLFATVRRPWTLPFSPLSTQHRDFLANDYYAVSPFEVDGLGRVEWRVRPMNESPSASSRTERLLAAVAERRADLILEYASYRSPLQIGDERSFRPLARVELQEVAVIDQNALRFDPFHDDRGIVPVGIVHWLRRATYAASRLQPHPPWRPAASGPPLGTGNGRSGLNLGPSTLGP